MRLTQPLKLGSLALLAGVLCLGCSDEDSNTVGTTRISLDPAWTAFAAGDWSGAGAGFLDALSHDPGYAEAWCGLGWARARELSSNGSAFSSEGVLEAFRQADRNETNYVDSWAGLAEYHNWAGDTLDALEWSLDAAETGGADYSFAHAAGVNHRSMRKIAAWNLFKLRRYDEAADQVLIVLPGFAWRGSPDSLELLFSGIGAL